MKNNIVMLTKYLPSDRNASQKAPQDIEEVFLKKHKCAMRVYKNNGYVLRNIDCLLRHICRKIRFSLSNAIAIVQWPPYPKRPMDNKSIVNFCKRKVALIHDLESIRFNFDNDSSMVENEISELNRFDVVITHNKHMTKWLLEHGLKSKTVELVVFDYLSDYSGDNTLKDKGYTICFAGNLSKSVFLRNISDAVSSRINLYGNKPSFPLSENIHYFGSFTPNELCCAMVGDFGLIWDGDSVDSCTGPNGIYMQYNNPHKLSLYISCGIPIITWKKAAIADFIMENGIGFVVESLHEVDKILMNISELEYLEMKNRINRIRKQVVQGGYTEAAIETAISIIEKRN